MMVWVMSHKLRVIITYKDILNEDDMQMYFAHTCKLFYWNLFEMFYIMFASFYEFQFTNKWCDKHYFNANLSNLPLLIALITWSISNLSFGTDF